MRNLLFIFLAFFLGSCSQYNHGVLSRGWHNLNSKYNALLIAKEDIGVAKEYIAKNYIENYEEVLPIYQRIDSTKLDTAKFYLIDAIKKASIIAEKHSNSKYLDPAYLLIGDARILKGEYENAIETFKYLNTVSSSEAIKTASMVQMLQAYVEKKDFQNADQLAAILKTRPFTKKNREVYLLNMAYYNQIKGENAIVAALLEEVVKTMKKGPEKARCHYILGQLYTTLNQTILARKNFRQVTKNKADYDLTFNSKLGLLMSESLGHDTENLFHDMLEDRKNQDLKYKLYYKMGETARKKRKTSDAIAYFKKSIADTSANEQSRGIAYKAIGDIYLDDLVDYDNAAVYYDSTVITLPKEYLDRTGIGERALFLNEFIKYRKVYQLEDSLQRLGQLSPEILDETLEKLIKEKREKSKKLSVQDLSKVVQGKTSNNSKKWMLYNPAEIVKQRNAFMQIWGNRDLEDNWRRRDKSSSTFVFNEKDLKKAVISTDSIQNSQTRVTINNEDQEIKEEIKEFKQRIPITKVQQIASKRKQEEAAYRIAIIYKLKFKDDKKAEESFKNFISNFPRSIYEPEVLYYLALGENDPLNNPYSEKLLASYPNTSFGRQIRKGTITMTNDLESKANEHYIKAFDLFNTEKYKEVISYLEEGLNEYVGSKIEDKMAMLRIFAMAKVSNKDDYFIALTDFLRAYPNSDLIPKAKDLMDALGKM